MAPLSEEDRENLVAYLDGELDEETARAIEARINVDPDVRAEADALKQAWEMLDFLPRPEPSSNFTHRTMERLTLQGPLSTMTMPRQRDGRRGPSWLLRTAGLIFVAAAGFALAVLLWPKPPPSTGSDQLDAILIEDMRVIENKHLYDHVEDLDFLKKLDEADLFDADSF
jgi:anti-sigma factor RsiW